MKKCTLCKEEKSLDSFYKNGKSADGKQWHCSDCVKKSGLLYRRKRANEWIKSGRYFRHSARSRVGRPMKCPICENVGTIIKYYDDYLNPVNPEFMCKCCRLVKQEEKWALKRDEANIKTIYDDDYYCGL